MSDKDRLTALPTTDWDDSLRRVIDDMGGRPLAVHGLLANHPDLLNAWWDLRNYTVSGGALSQRQTEIVILRVAWHMQNWYEWGSHVERGLEAGLTIDEIERIRTGPQGAGWSDAERLLFAAVDELFEQKRLGEASMKKLGAHYSDRQLLDLIVIVGTYTILGCVLNTWPVDLDAHVQAKLPPGISRAGFEEEFSGS
jgi:alkylhydroperoxidase family enzyme